MTDKALISSLTWRSIEMQQAAFADMPIYVGPKEIGEMLRATTRKESDNIHVLSLGVIAEKEGELRDFLSLMAKRKATLISKEDGKHYVVNGSHAHIVRDWKAARRAGIQKIGGKISAEKRKAESLEAIERIRERWPLPSSVWPTHVLLKECGKSLNTVKAVLGRRPIEQANYQAKLKRREKRNAGR